VVGRRALDVFMCNASSSAAGASLSISLEGTAEILVIAASSSETAV